MHDIYSQEKQLLSNRAHTTYTIIHRRNSFKAIELARLILDRRLGIGAYRRACRFLMVSVFLSAKEGRRKKGACQGNIDTSLLSSQTYFVY